MRQAFWVLQKIHKKLVSFSVKQVATVGANPTDREGKNK